MPAPIFSGPGLDGQVQQLLASSWADPKADPDGAVQAPADAKGIGPWPYLAAAGGQALDGASSVRNFGRGYGEGNPLYGTGQPAGRLLATKAGISVATMLLMKAIAKKNPAAAKALGYGVGAAGAVPGVYNLTRPDVAR